MQLSGSVAWVQRMGAQTDRQTGGQVYNFMVMVAVADMQDRGVWFHGVVVSTQDSESCDPSSNLGGT